MSLYFPKRFVLGVLCTLPVSGVVFSAPSDESWAVWLNQQINQHPEIVAARETMQAAFSMAEGRTKPLYNPELDTEFERSGQDNNYRLGINQTVDWWNKREVRSQQASYSRMAAKQAYELKFQQKMAAALQALIEWQGASQQAQLAAREEQQLDTLLRLTKKRQQAGDLGQIDAELAILSLSTTLNSTAQAEVRLKRIEVNVAELLPNIHSQSGSTAWTKIPNSFWHTKGLVVQNPTQAGQWADQYPAVIAAKSEWEVLQKAAELAQLETKADPTFGVNAGKSGQDNILALTFSIPLNVRNKYRAESRAASQDALSAEAQYHNIRRKQQFNIESSFAIKNAYQQRFERWKGLMKGRDKRSQNLLEKLWRSGDMGTAEYILGLQQRSAGLTAGIALRSQFQSAYIDWLLQTGQINTVLKQIN